VVTTLTALSAAEPADVSGRRPTHNALPLALSMREAEQSNPRFHFPLSTLALCSTLLFSSPPTARLAVEHHHHPSQSSPKPRNQFAVFSSVRCMSFGLSHQPTTPAESPPYAPTVDCCRLCTSGLATTSSRTV
jgi:hypothetical protein